MEQSAVDECFRGGGWAKRMGMCSEEQRCFERCFLMQSVCSFRFPLPPSALCLLRVVNLAGGLGQKMKSPKLDANNQGSCLISYRDS